MTTSHGNSVAPPDRLANAGNTDYVGEVSSASQKSEDQPVPHVATAAGRKAQQARPSQVEQAARKLIRHHATQCNSRSTRTAPRPRGPRRDSEASLETTVDRSPAARVA